MSYIDKKSRIFNESGEGPPVPKRYDGKMKSYDSAIDARAWCDHYEDRRQYILDLVKQREEGKSLCLGKYIPIEVIIDILLASKNAEIKKLQDLLDMYSRLNLTPEQLSQLDNMKQSAADMPPEGRVEEELEKGERERFEQEKENLIDESSSLTSDAEVTSEEDYGTPYSAGELTEETDEGEETPEQASIVIEGYEINSIIEEEEEDMITSIVDKDATITELQKALDEQTGIALAAIQQLEAIEDIVGDLDPKQRQKQQSVPCRADIEALEYEIEEMKRNQPAGQGVDILQKELEILKKYCTQLSEMQNRNLQNGLSSSPDGDLMVNSSSSDGRAEISRLQAKIKQLEQELATYRGEEPQLVPENENEEVAIVDQQREGDLQRRLENLKGLDDKVAELKKKVKDCENEYRRNSLASNAELQNIRGKCDESDNKILCLENEIDQLKSKICCMTNEKQCLKSRLDELCCVQEECQELLNKTKNFEKIKCDAKKYKKKYEELVGLQCDYENLNCKLTNLEKERNNLLEEIKHMECCMQSQNDEIQKLVSHIKCLTDGRDQQQKKTKETLCQMREELEKKDDIITDAQLKLAELQDQLCSSIDDVTNETQCLCKRIEELEGQLHTSKTMLSDKENEICLLCTEIQNQEKSKKDNECKLIAEFKKQILQLCEENNKIQILEDENNKLKDELDKAMNAFKADKHLRSILKQSKCAIAKVTETLGKRLLEEKDKIGDQKRDEDKDEDSKMYNEKKDNEIGNLRKRVSELENKINKLEDGLSTADGLISNLRSKSTNLEAELKQAQQQKIMLEQSMHELTPKVDEIQELRKLSARIQDSAKEQLSKFQAESQAELIKVQAESQAQILDIKAKNKELQLENDKLTEDMKDLLKQLKDLEIEKNRLEELAKTEDDDAVMVAEMHRLQTDLDKEIKITQDLRDEIAKLKAGELAVPEVDQHLTKERDGLLKQIDDQKGEINDLLEKIKQLSTGDATPATDDQCAKLLETERNEKENLKKLVTDLENQLNSIQAVKADDHFTKIKDLEDELAKQKKDCTDKMAKLKEQYEKDIQNIQKQNRNSIQKLHNDQENYMKNLESGHEKQVEGLKKELKASKIQLKTVIREKGKLNEQINEERKKSSLVPTPSGRLQKSKSPQRVPNLKPIQEIYIPNGEEKADPKSTDGPKPKAGFKPRDKSTDKESIGSDTDKDKEKKEPSKSVEKAKALPKSNLQGSCICAKFPAIIAIPTIPSDKVIRNVPEQKQVTINEPAQHGNFDQNIVEKCTDTAMNKYITNRGDNDRDTLLKRLYDVENALLIKQKCAKAKADELQMKVNELKKDLEFERLRNSDLKDKTICQTKMVAIMKNEINSIKEQNMKDRQQLNQFNSIMQEEQQRSKQLEMQLQMEREKLRNEQNRVGLVPRNQSPLRYNKCNAQPFYTEVRRNVDVIYGCNQGIRR